MATVPLVHLHPMKPYKGNGENDIASEGDGRLHTPDPIVHLTVVMISDVASGSSNDHNYGDEVDEEDVASHVPFFNDGFVEVTASDVISAACDDYDDQRNDDADDEFASEVSRQLSEQSHAAFSLGSLDPVDVTFMNPCTRTLQLILAHFDSIMPDDELLAFPHDNAAIYDPSWADDHPISQSLAQFDRKYESRIKLESMVGGAIKVRDGLDVILTADNGDAYLRTTTYVFFNPLAIQWNITKVPH
ncbi:MAG: hypothetical protein Q9170_005896 [Blastenia crenularia]